VTVKPAGLRDLPLAELARFPGNARRGNVPEIRKSVARLGQYRAIVVRSHDGHLTILAGNHTADALAAEGHETARCEVIECDDDEARRINLADNRTGELPSPETGERYDGEALAVLLSQLDGDYDGSGWDAEDLAALLAPGDPGPAPGNTDPDEVPPLPADPSTVPGDLFRLGDHMLLCGDATKRADVQRLMDGERAPVMVTDPPYGVAYHANKKGVKAASIAGDLTQAAIPLGFAVAVEVALDDDARVYLFGGTANWPMYSSLFDHHLRMQPRPMIWVKEGFVLHPTHYHSQYETVFFGWKGKGGGPGHWYGDRKQSDVWEVSRDPDRVHPTQKPVEVCAIPIRHSAPPGGLVYEPFGGSGSTLIAAHMLGRRARVLELDPLYCDIILRRFERFAGIKPERVT
jgi:hypothetical protein